MTLSKESARLGVVLRDGRDVRVAFVRHEDHPGLQAMHLVGLALGDHHKATGDERLACALVARDVEDRARLDVELATQHDPFHGGLGVDVERLLRAPLIFRVEAVLVCVIINVAREFPANRGGDRAPRAAP